jgi:hypothetical protein
MPAAWQRYNNPGNVSLPISGWQGGGSIVGIRGQSGYASFPSMAVGLQAFQQRITNYIDGKGYDTIAKMGAHYAEDPTWGAKVSNFSGIGINDRLDTSNPTQMAALQKGILTQEIGPAGANSALGGAVTTPVNEPYLEPGPIGGFRPEHLTQDVATGEDYLYGPPPISGAFGVSDKELNAITNYYSPVQHNQADAWQDYQQDAQAGDAPSRAELGLPGGAVGAGKGISGDVGDIKQAEQGTFVRQMTPEEEAAMPGPAGQAGIGGGTGQQAGGESPFGGAPGGGSGEQSGGSSGAQSSDSTAGNPIYVTNPSVIAVKAGEQVKKGAEQMGKDVKESGKKLGEDVTKTGQALDQQIDSSTGQVTSTAKSITQYVGDLVYHVFPRITVGVGALILVLIGLWMLGNQPKVLQKVT